MTRPLAFRFQTQTLKKDNIIIIVQKVSLIIDCRKLKPLSKPVLLSRLHLFIIRAKLIALDNCHHPCKVPMGVDRLRAAILGWL